MVEPEGFLAGILDGDGSAEAALVLSEEERVQLQSLARSRSLPAGLVQRASLVLACAEGAANSAVAERFGVADATVGKWRRRFVARRIAGLHDELRPGKPRSIDDERIAGLLTTTLHHRPKDGATHWSVRGLAAATGISKTSVHRLLQLFGLQPHRQESFKLSTDPFFVEKLRDVVGLYLNPPDKALVLCVDEKSQVQALERTLEGRQQNGEKLDIVLSIFAHELAGTAVASIGRSAARDGFYDRTLYLRRLDKAATLVPLHPRPAPPPASRALVQPIRASA